MSAAKAAKAALFADCQAIFPDPILVTYGPARTYEPADIIELLDVRSTQVEGAQSPQRKRYETLELDGVINCYSGGGTEVQQTVTERAYDLLNTLEAYLQDSGVQNSTKATFNGLVWWARMDRHEMHELTDDDDPEAFAAGCCTVIGFTIVCKTKI